MHGRLQYIWIFGKTIEGRSAAKVPCLSYLYIDCPGWAKADVSVIGRELYRCIKGTFPGSISACEYVKRKKFMGYQGDREFDFVKVSFVCSDALRMCGNVLRRRALNFSNNKTYEFTVYESNVDPIIRFFHENSLQPTGWIQLSETEAVVLPDKKESSCELEYHCKSARSLSPFEADQKAPFV